MVADPSQGPNFLTATATSLTSGTNYTVLAVVASTSGGSSGSGSNGGLAFSPTVTALSGLLVPDTVPPSFTRAAVTAAAPDTGATGAADGTFSMNVELGLNEAGQVYYGVYGDPVCIAGECEAGLEA